MATYLIYDDIYLEHTTGSHPENADRLRRTMDYLKCSSAWAKLDLLNPRRATLEEISYIHQPEYIKTVKEVAEKGGGYLGLDTVLSSRSYEAALFAVGGILIAIDKIIEKKHSNAFCLIRPPGHHATSNQGMGFCLFNNVAIAARYLQKKYSLNRVAIIDWDLHHGNGTQDAFYDDPSVLYMSLHLYPYYPGTGAAEEIGESKGKGYTINFPCDDSTPNQAYLIKFEQGLNKIKSFTPEFILISAGFDAYKNDPLGGLDLAVEDYLTLTQKVITLAKECCEGRVVSALEGGYDLEGLPHCIEAHLKGLLTNHKR